MYYFAYGSNMDLEDFSAWCKKKNCVSPKLSDRKPVLLRGYRLQFNYYSDGRGAGAANIMEGDNKDVVYGLLCEISNKERSVIRRKEGWKEGNSGCYQEIDIKVETFNGQIFSDVLTYKVNSSYEKPNHIPPTKDYLNLIISNSSKFGFPSEYIGFLKSVVTADKKNEKYLCPVHNISLCRMPVMYGMPIIGIKYDDVILGGCCVEDDSPKFGYRCPVGREDFFIRNGELIPIQEWYD